MTTIRLLHPFEVDAVWPALHEGMDRACRKARCNRSATEIYQACRVGAWFLHVVEEDSAEEGGDPIVMAGIATHIDGTVVTVHALCGRDMDRWLPELLTLPFWPMLGVTTAAWGGRVGLERMIRKAMPRLKHVRSDFELELRDAAE